MGDRLSSEEGMTMFYKATKSLGICKYEFIVHALFRQTKLSSLDIEHKSRWRLLQDSAIVNYTHKLCFLSLKASDYTFE